MTLINYKKDGTQFWNHFFVAPLRGIDGKVTHFVGVQMEISDVYANELLTRNTAPNNEAVHARVSRSTAAAALSVGAGTRAGAGLGEGAERPSRTIGDSFLLGLEADF